jgi:beta-glucanase (GH16 family)
MRMALRCPAYVALMIFAVAVSAHPGDTKAAAWATTRQPTGDEQREIKQYRDRTSPWAFQVDFHNRTQAESQFEPVTDDLVWLKSCRQPENVVINGALRLQTKLAKHCRGRWSTGYVVSRSFSQLHGYFEARMKITKKPGINNAFWLTGKHLEIDIVEARMPNIIHMTLHDWGNPRRAKLCTYSAGHLDDQMHDYGLLWLPDRLIFSFDGNAVCTIESKFPAVPAEIRFSTAIANFEGHTYEGQSDDPTGTEMDVAWVHAAPLNH